MRTRVRFVRAVDRDGRRYEAGEVAEVTWPNVDQLAAWGVLVVLPAKEVADGGIQRQRRGPVQR